MEESITLPRSRRTRQQIEDLMAEFRKSAYSAQEFCRMKNISRGTFYKWQSRSKSRSKNRLCGFAKLKMVVAPPSGGLFAEVKGIKIHQVVSAAYLKELNA